MKLVFLRLQTVETAVQRVAQRVREGGHDVPDPVIRRRFHAGWNNFRQVCRDIVDEWVLFDNSSDEPKLLEEWSRR